LYPPNSCHLELEREIISETFKTFKTWIKSAKIERAMKLLTADSPKKKPVNLLAITELRRWTSDYVLVFELLSNLSWFQF